MLTAILNEGETVAELVDMSTAVNGVTEALTTGFTSLNTALIAGVGSIIAVGIVLFGIKFAPRFLKSLFRTISA